VVQNNKIFIAISRRPNLSVYLLIRNNMKEDSGTISSGLRFCFTFPISFFFLFPFILFSRLCLLFIAFFPSFYLIFLFSLHSFLLLFCFPFSFHFIIYFSPFSSSVTFIIFISSIFNPSILHFNRSSCPYLFLLSFH